MQRILATLLEEFRDTLLAMPKGTHRRLSFPKAENLIKIVTGMRRVGKTHFLFQEILSLQEQKVPLERILYLNFEDDRLLPMDYKEMGKLIDDFYTLFPENHTKECYIFLDEVQNIPDWAVVVRRFFDSKKVQLYLTGSSAKLLSKEIATALRGRSIEIEMWPFSFLEFIETHNLPLPNTPFGKKSLDEMRKNLVRFMHEGGFPGVQFLSSPTRQHVLQGYVETVIFRDIVERYKVSNISLLRYTINSLLKTIASPFSINKFYKDIKSQGYTVSKDTLYNYLSYVEDAYLLFGISNYSESVRQRKTAPKKIYAVDTGLILANTFNRTDNYGKLLENIVFTDLKRQGKDVFYFKTKNGFEIDFVATSKDHEPRLIQVVWDASDTATRQREERALHEAEKELGIAGELLDFASYVTRGV